MPWGAPAAALNVKFYQNSLQTAGLMVNREASQNQWLTTCVQIYIYCHRNQIYQAKYQSQAAV